MVSLATRLIPSDPTGLPLATKWGRSTDPFGPLGDGGGGVRRVWRVVRFGQVAAVETLLTVHSDPRRHARTGGRPNDAFHREFGGTN